jgi:hypothetical protein
MEPRVDNAMESLRFFRQVFQTLDGFNHKH